MGGCELGVLNRSKWHLPTWEYTYKFIYIAFFIKME